MTLKPLNTFNGSAIIIALFVMAIVSIAATAMMARFQIDVRRTEMMLTSNKAFLILQGVEFWGKGLLETNANKSTTANPVIDKVPTTFQDHFQNYPITGQLEDRQGKFNLNNLIDLKYEKSFIALLLASIKNLTPQQATKLAEALINQLVEIKKDPTSDKPPSVRIKMLLASPSELRTMTFLTREHYLQLAPYVTALPKKTKLNINTAPATVLMSLSIGMTREQANTLVTYRKQNFPLKASDFLNHPIIKDQLQITSDIEKRITDRSDFFMTKAVVSIDKVEYVLYTALQRMGKQVMVLWQSLGAY